MCSSAAGRNMTRKTMTSINASDSTHGRTVGDMRPTKVLSRMCSPRRSAITAPSIASHRNRIDASSSDQVSGWLNT